jgi:hypothetical protein
VIVSVATFLERIDVLPKSKEEGGLRAAGRKARDLLTKRGLHPEVIAKARALLGKVGKIESIDASTSEVPSEREEMLERLRWSHDASTLDKNSRCLSLAEQSFCFEPREASVSNVDVEARILGWMPPTRLFGLDGGQNHWPHSQLRPLLLMPAPASATLFAN